MSTREMWAFATIHVPDLEGKYTRSEITYNNSNTLHFIKRLIQCFYIGAKENKVKLQVIIIHNSNNDNTNKNLWQCM